MPTTSKELEAQIEQVKAELTALNEEIEHAEKSKNEHLVKARLSNSRPDDSFAIMHNQLISTKSALLVHKEQLQKQLVESQVIEKDFRGFQSVQQKGFAREHSARILQDNLAEFHKVVSEFYAAQTLFNISHGMGTPTLDNFIQQHCSRKNKLAFDALADEAFETLQNEVNELPSNYLGSKKKVA